MSYSILKNKKLQRQLDEEGIVSFPLLDEGETAYLLNLFYKMNTGLDTASLNRYYICLHSTDRPYKEYIHKEVKNIVLPKAKQLLNPFKDMAYTLQMKGVGEKTELMIHQDWCLTDEKIFKSYTFWIPLVDSHADNGTIFSIRGSHQTMRVMRCGSLLTPFENIRELVFKKMKPEPVKSGHALIFDSALVHYSPPNKTNVPRISAVTNIVPEEANLLLYYQDPSIAHSPMEIYQVPNNFFLLYNDFHKERELRPFFGKKIGELDYFKFHQFDAKEFKQRFASIQKPKSIFQKMKQRFFGYMQDQG